MKLTLPPLLIAAIAAYFEHRDNQVPGVRWNKEQDLDNIEAVAIAEGFRSMEACCGTFWFGKKVGTTTEIFKCNDDDYTGEIIGTNPQGQSEALSALGFSAGNCLKP